MIPLILIYFSIGVVYGKPGSLNYPTPTPSAPPAILANLPTPTPSVASSLLTENVPYSGQFGIPPIVRIEGKPQPQFGLPFADPRYNFVQPQFNFAQQGFNFAQPGFNFAQPGFNFAQPGFNFAQPEYNFAQPGFNFAQPGLNFGEQFFNPGGTQLSSDAKPSVTQFGITPVEQDLNIRCGKCATPTRPTPDIGKTPIQSNVSPTQVSVTPAQIKVSPVKTTPSSSRVEYLAEERNVGGSSDGTIVHKYIYFHVPPPEPEIEQPVRVVVTRPQKHLRVIFIKAPDPPEPVVAVPPPNDDRTIVYILARRPEAPPEIKIETTTPTSPPKPEVYFIRYNAQKQSVANVDTTAGTETTEEAHGGTSAVTENPFRIDTRFNSDADDNEEPKAVTLNLNEASLTGGSALSQAVTGPADDNSIFVSTTPATSYSSTSDRKEF